MFAFDNLAPKLLLSEILNAPVVETDSGPKLASHGIYYNRVQVQGSLEGNCEQGYCVRDITGFIPVALTPPQAAEVEAEQQPNTSIPVIVIGEIFETAPSAEEEEAAAALEEGTPVPTSKRYIKVKTLIRLSRESNSSEQWMLEVDELARHVAFASSGDESWEFRTCVATCRQTGCATAEGRRKNTTDTTLTEEIKEIMTDFASVNYCSPLCDAKNKVYQHADTFWLKLSSWECSSDCSYRCMWLLEDQKRRTKAAVAPVAIEKYFGKWPFIRALGAQEPASVLFSILNLVANTVCFFKILDMPQQYRNNIKSSIWNTRPSTRSISTSSPSTTAGATSTTISTIQVYYSLWLTHFALSSNAWFWSSIFHCRDTGLTERLDYFSAGALVGFNLFLSVTRVAGVVKLKIFASIGLCILLMYSIHVYRMLNVLFDYGFHVGLCVAAGAVQTAVWLAWALGSKYGKSHPGKVYLLSFMAAVNVAMLLEILDFPPLWKMIDAHALWHAATAPLTVLWYRFVAADVALLLGSRSSYKTKS